MTVFQDRSSMAQYGSMTLREREDKDKRVIFMFHILLFLINAIRIFDTT